MDRISPSRLGITAAFCIAALGGCGGGSSSDTMPDLPSTPEAIAADPFPGRKPDDSDLGQQLSHGATVDSNVFFFKCDVQESLDRIKSQLVRLGFEERSGGAVGHYNYRLGPTRLMAVFAYAGRYDTSTVNGVPDSDGEWVTFRIDIFTWPQ